MRSRRNRRRAISPVIATVIIVAVTIAVAISAAFWLGGLTGLFTRFERVEFPVAYVSGSAPAYTITLDGKNTGSADATVIDVLIREKPVGAFDSGNFSITFTVTPPGGSATTTAYARTPGGGGVSYGAGVNVNIVSGAKLKADLKFSSTAPVVSGQTIEVRILTSGGNSYGKSVSLT